jgi:light-harvesting complex 1 beta chain
MANMQLNQERERTGETVTFRMVFALGFVVVLAIALVGSLTGMPWRSWLPGAESCKSLFGGVQAAVYSFMSHTL